ncbi:hypothetical protein ACFE04_010865 [Oxalis oulophora]
MAPANQKLTEYEKKRLENIKRNQEMFASLNIHSSIPPNNKRQRNDNKYPNKKKNKPDNNPTLIRKSLRKLGIQPELEGLKDCEVDEPTPQRSPSPQGPSPMDECPLNITDVFIGEGSSNKKLINIILDVAKKCQSSTPVTQLLGEEVKDELDEGKNNHRSASIQNEDLSGLKKESANFGVNVKLAKCKFQSVDSLDLASLSLNKVNIAKLVPRRIMSVKFLPSNDLRMVIAGDDSGNLAFWNMESNKGEDADRGIFLYRPHSGYVSGIAVQQPCLSKIFTSCYEGFVRLMDAEKEVFDLVYKSDDSIFSLSQRPNDAHTLYFAEGNGIFNSWDVRTGKCLAEVNIHTSRINTIDFSSTDNNIMATSSSDGTACIWDVRCMDAAKPKALKIMNNQKPVQSAYFSPSGRSLATTSSNGTVGIMSGNNFENTCMILHDNESSTWLSHFRASWGWDDSYLFVGNTNKGVDIISAAHKRTFLTLVSPLVTTIPCRFDAHPYQVGMLAGATGGGQVYVWTS